MKLMILDGNSVINRAFFGVRLLSTNDGLFTNAIFGFLNILERMRTQEKPDALCVRLPFCVSRPCLSPRPLFPVSARTDFPVSSSFVFVANTRFFQRGQPKSIRDCRWAASNSNTQNPYHQADSESGTLAPARKRSRS